MKKKEDRRVRITKQAIRDSLFELMQQYPIGKISVKMICDTADINRSTFYAHYKDQHDLLDTVQKEAVQAIEEHIRAASFIQQAESVAPVIVKILEYCKKNQTMYRVLFSENGDTVFQRQLVLMAQQKTLDEIRKGNQLDARTTKYLELFAVAGILSMIRTWLWEGCVDEPETLAAMMTTLLYEGIWGLFRGRPPAAATE